MKRITTISVVLLVVVTLLVACGPQESEKPPDEVTVQLNWYHQAEFAGFYAADQQGFYAGENIDVTFKAGGPDIPPETIVSDVIRGDSTFAIVGADTVLAARYRDEPVVAVAVVFQRNPQCYAVLKNSGIERPRDLMGKKVMVPLNGLIQHEALLEKMDIDLDSVEVIPYEYDVTPLCTRQVDAHQLNRTTLGLLLEEKGCEPNFIWIDDYGVRFYADTIVTSDEFVHKNPGLVERFLEATLKGWRYAIENSDKVADMIVRYDPSADRDYQKKQMEAQIPLIHTGETPIGWMDKSVWGEMQATFIEARIEAMKRIEEIAKQAAKQVGDYIRDHPNMTVQDLQNDPSFREIAIQQVGKTGYTGIADSKTGLHYFHPKRELENKSTHEVFKEPLPELWAIFNQAIGETCKEASGFYLWETEGKLWEKYMYIACIDAQTADGKSLLLGAGTYLADYAVPFSTKEIDLDQVVDMQFLKEIYGQTE